MMQLLNLLIALILGLSLAEARKKINNLSSIGLIHNGSSAIEGQFPYQVYLCVSPPTWPKTLPGKGLKVVEGGLLRLKPSSVVGTLYCNGHCGGILISDQWILTAAHCMPKTHIRVLLGTNNRICWALHCTGVMQDIPAENMIIHPKYVPEMTTATHGYDIGLLKMRRPINLSKNIQPAKLPNQNFKVPPGEVLVTSGWGMTGHKNGDLPFHLQYTTGKSISHEECTKTFKNLNKEIVCFKSDKGTGVCPGDSGGPLIFNRTKEIIGITSFMHDNPKGCEGGYPFAYTKVSSYIDWIYKETGIKHDKSLS